MMQISQTKRERIAGLMATCVNEGRLTLLPAAAGQLEGGAGAGLVALAGLLREASEGVTRVLAAMWMIPAVGWQ